MDAQKVAVAVVLLLVVAAAGYYLVASGPGGEEKEKIVVYVYESFMAWGDDPEAVWDMVFNEFSRQYGVEVEVVTFDDARTALLQAINEKERGVRTANVIIGVDNLLVYEAKKAGIIECYYSPVAEQTVPDEIANALDPEKCVTPFDYGLIALVYDPARLPEEIVDILESPTLDDLARPEVASRLIVEDPTKSSPGLAFLFWQIAVSDKLEGKDWTEWWQEVRDQVYVAPSWGDAYDLFLGGGDRAIVVSYGTDAAYSAWYNKGEPSMGMALIWSGGKSTAWLQVEGIVLVKDQPGNDVAKKFIDWLLSVDVQELVPSNQWMLPANSQAPLPDYYKYALTLDDVDIVANDLLSPDEIDQFYQQWLATWTRIMAGS